MERVMGSLERRLEALEGIQTAPEDRTEVRARIRENLDRIATLRRGDGPEDVAELEAFSEAVEREKVKRRGRGLSLMARCSGFKPDGTPCERIVSVSQTHCYAHDPARSEERRRNASRAGRSKPSKELSEVKGRLRELAEGVIEGRVDRGNAAVAGQLLGTFIRASTAEIKIKEVMELEERIAALEEFTEGGQRGHG